MRILISVLSAISIVSCSSRPQLPEGHAKSPSQSDNLNKQSSGTSEKTTQNNSQTPGSQTEPTDNQEPASNGGTQPVDPVTPAIEPQNCPNGLAVSRLQKWTASEGTMQPSNGESILTKEGNDPIAKVDFIGNDWHVVPIWLKNQFDAEVDLSKSKGMTLIYSATADLYVQMRPSFEWSGGNKYLAKLPSTGGSYKTLFIDFQATSWTTLDALGKPSYSWAETIQKARGLVLVGHLAGTMKFKSLVIDGYEPPCL